MLITRVVGVLALALGLLGLAACAVAVFHVWSVESRLQRANDRAFGLVDRGLETVQDRVHRTQDRVEQSRITTSEITQKLRQWSTAEIKDRLVTQFEVESRTDRLAGQLQAADQWLETSSDSVRDIQRLLELSRSLGAGVDPGSLEEVLATIGSVRSTVQETERAVAEIRAFAMPAAGESESSRIARVLKLLARVLVMITEIGPRLGRLENRIAELRSDAAQVGARTSNYIFWTAVGCTAILVWVAAGQGALFLCGWRGCCRGRP